MSLPACRFAAAVLAALVATGPEALMAQAPPAPTDPTVPAPASSAGPPAEAQATGIVRGRVVAADTGLPLRRVTVLLRSTSDQRGLATDTDVDGVFTFDAVPKGRYRLKASKARYVDTALGARTPGRPGRAFDLGDGQKIEGLTIRLTPAGVITGRVLDDAGEPVAGASVTAARRTRAASGVTRMAPATHWGSTDDTGAYRLFGLPPGRYYLAVGPHDRTRDGANTVHTSPTRLAPTYYPSTPVASDAQPIDVTAGSETIADVALVATQVTTVSGDVVDAAGRTPLAGFVHLLPTGQEDASGRQFTGMHLLNKSSAFTVSGVAPGDYTLVVRAYFDEAEMLRLVSSGSVDGGAFTMPVSVSGTPISDLRIVIPPPVEVSGRVHFEGGTPAGGATAVNIFGTGLPEDRGASVRAQVGADGRFTLQVPAGSWRFAAFTPGGWMMKRLQFRGRSIELDGAVEVTAEPGARLDVLLTSQLTAVTGTARDAAGAPLVDYHAVIMPADQKERRWDHRTRLERADAHGRFRVEGLLPGDYVVAAIDDIEPNEALDEDVLAALRASGTPVRVRDGQTETVVLKLAPLP